MCIIDIACVGDATGYALCYLNENSMRQKLERIWFIWPPTDHQEGTDGVLKETPLST